MTLDDLMLPNSVWEKAGHLLEPLEGKSLPVAAGYYVLVVQWKRRERTAGGIILSHHAHDEDKYQGRCGLVVSVGEDAYTGSKFSKHWCKVGDWVAWPALSNAAYRMEYGGVVVTAIPDDQVVLVGVDPELVT